MSGYLGASLVALMLLVHSSKATTEQPRIGDVNCLVGDPFDASAETAMHHIDFFYAVENSQNSTDLFSTAIESMIFQEAKSSITWCYQYGGGRRRIEEDGHEYFIDNHGRRLGIMAIDPWPMDINRPDLPCPEALELENPDNFCFVMEGKMTLLSHSTDDLTMTIDHIRAGVKQAMLDGELIDEVTIPTVAKVTYLGETEDDVLLWDVDSVDGSDKSIAGGGVRNAVFVPLLTASLVGVGIIALLLLLVRQRRLTATKRQMNNAAAIAASSSVDSNMSGDPPGSFHQGYYHYTKDGIRYLSPYCSTCIETERQLADGVGLQTITEDEEWDEGGRLSRLVAANSKNLGGKHSTMDVHQCTSSLCQECQEARRQAGVSFQRWREQVNSDMTFPDAGSYSIPSPKREKSGDVVEV